MVVLITTFFSTVELQVCRKEHVRLQDVQQKFFSSEPSGTFKMLCVTNYICLTSLQKVIEKVKMLSNLAKIIFCS